MYFSSLSHWRAGIVATVYIPVKLQPWFLSLRLKTCLWAELQPWCLSLQWTTCPWAEHSDDILMFFLGFISLLKYCWAHPIKWATSRHWCTPRNGNPMVSGQVSEGARLLSLHIQSIHCQRYHSSGDTRRSCGTNTSSSWSHPWYDGNLSKSSA